jgi:hypothetical protein
MYHKIGIEKLSHNQMLKMLRGHAVRVKHGAHQHIHVSAEQHKKIMAAHRRGCGCNIMMDPYQQDMHRHGEGFLNKLERVGTEIGKTASPVAVNLAGKYAEKSLLGNGMHKHRRRPKKHHPKHGESLNMAGGA